MAWMFSISRWRFSYPCFASAQQQLCWQSQHFTMIRRLQYTWPRKSLSWTGQHSSRTYQSSAVTTLIPNNAITSAKVSFLTGQQEGPPQTPGQAYQCLRARYAPLTPFLSLPFTQDGSLFIVTQAHPVLGLSLQNLHSLLLYENLILPSLLETPGMIIRCQSSNSL